MVQCAPENFSIFTQMIIAPSNSKRWWSLLMIALIEKLSSKVHSKLWSSIVRSFRFLAILALLDRFYFESDFFKNQEKLPRKLLVSQANFLAVFYSAWSYFKEKKLPRPPCPCPQPLLPTKNTKTQNGDAYACTRTYKTPNTTNPSITRHFFPKVLLQKDHRSKFSRKSFYAKKKVG